MAPGPTASTESQVSKPVLGFFCLFFARKLWLVRLGLAPSGPCPLQSTREGFPEGLEVLAQKVNR